MPAPGHQGGFLDDLWWLMRGLAIGLAVAIPVGPIALLCMRRTLERGFLIGFGTGLGAAVADLLYSSIAAFGISARTGSDFSQTAQVVKAGKAVVITSANTSTVR